MTRTTSAPPRPSPSPAWTPAELAADPHGLVDKPERVRQMFAAISRTYDLNNRLHSFGRDQAWRRAAVRAAAVRSTDRVLDVACGTGDLTVAFCHAGADSVIGCDFTSEMLELARAKSLPQQHRISGTGGVCKGGGTPRYDQADALDLPYDDGSFDIVSIAFGIRNVADPDRAIAEFRRVLRRGGRLVVLEFDQPHNALIRMFNNLYCKHIMPLTATLIARDRSGAYRYLPRSIATFLSAEQIAQRMRDRGFARTAITRLTFGVCAITLGTLE